MPKLELTSAQIAMLQAAQDIFKREEPGIEPPTLERLLEIVLAEHSPESIAENLSAFINDEQDPL